MSCLHVRVKSARWAEDLEVASYLSISSMLLGFHLRNVDCAQAFGHLGDANRIAVSDLQLDGVD